MAAVGGGGAVVCQGLGCGRNLETLFTWARKPADEWIIAELEQLSTCESDCVAEFHWKKYLVGCDGTIAK